MRPSAAILGAFHGAVAESYRREIGRRTRRGLEGRAIAGKPAGGRAYGYVAAAQSESGDVEIDPVQAEVVLRIFMMYADGQSPRAIAETLNAENVPSPGSTFSACPASPWEAFETRLYREADAARQQTATGTLLYVSGDS